MGILIEHFGGAFPLWLAPVQVAVLADQREVQRLCDRRSSQRCRTTDLRVEADLGAGQDRGQDPRCQLAKDRRILLIIGEKEADRRSVAFAPIRCGRRDSGNDDLHGVLSSDAEQEIATRGSALTATAKAVKPSAWKRQLAMSDKRIGALQCRSSLPLLSLGPIARSRGSLDIRVRIRLVSVPGRCAGLVGINSIGDVTPFLRIFATTSRSAFRRSGSSTTRKNRSGSFPPPKPCGWPAKPAWTLSKLPPPPARPFAGSWITANGAISSRRRKTSPGPVPRAAG